MLVKDIMYNTYWNAIHICRLYISNKNHSLKCFWCVKGFETLVRSDPQVGIKGEEERVEGGKQSGNGWTEVAKKTFPGVKDEMKE